MLRTISCKVLLFKSPLESLTKLPLSKLLIFEALNSKIIKQFFEKLPPISLWRLWFNVQSE